jgi:hypothetical protein
VNALIDGRVMSPPTRDAPFVEPEGEARAAGKIPISPAPLANPTTSQGVPSTFSSPDGQASHLAARSTASASTVTQEFILRALVPPQSTSSLPSATSVECL